MGEVRCYHGDWLGCPGDLREVTQVTIGVGMEISSVTMGINNVSNNNSHVICCHGNYLRLSGDMFINHDN